MGITLILLLALALLNPFTLHSLLTESGLTSRTLTALVLLLDSYFLAILVLYYFSPKKSRRKSLAINNTLLIGTSLLFLGAAAFSDFVVGKVRQSYDLIFRPHTSASYQTPEFTYTACINNLGFRGPDVPRKLLSAGRKILMIGDSFTFGWGLNLEETWPYLVQSGLKLQGRDYCVYNLGKPGSNPIEYVDIARRALALIKPDLLIVNVLQGDDLFQMMPDLNQPPSAPGFQQRLSAKIQNLQALFKALFPHLNGLAFGSGMLGSADINLVITPEWIKQSQQIYQSFSPEQKARCDSLPGVIKEMFFAGQLNPKLIYDSMVTPDRFTAYDHLDAANTERAAYMLGRNLQTINDDARAFHCPVIVCLIPNRPYVSPAGLRIMWQMGYQLNDGLLTSVDSEVAIQRAAQSAGLPFFSPLASFREAQGDSLYYLYDGHFNKLGAQKYAEFMTEVIVAYLTSAVSAHPQ